MIGFVKQAAEEVLEETKGKQSATRNIMMESKNPQATVDMFIHKKEKESLREGYMYPCQ